MTGSRDEGIPPRGNAERADTSWLAARFEDHRSHLRSVAYRILGSMAEAEDAVQDAWLRVSRANASEVDNLGGWLTTIVARLALDRLRSRASRREQTVGVRLPDPIVTPLDGHDPGREAELADSVGLAMLVVLETLTPAERLAFVLHDTFGLPFDEIGRIIERTPVAARQLASRARRRVRDAADPRPVPADRQRELVRAFLAAARDGDFEALLHILDPAVVVRSDTLRARDAAGSGIVRGAEAAARQAISFRRLAPGAIEALVNGSPGFVVMANGRPYAVLGFGFRADVIAAIDVVLAPERLAALDLSGVV
ncbi:MAG TPA: RNA polymerase sigma factor SigJ [Candidatus Limnocylindrales bacterium]